MSSVAEDLLDEPDVGAVLVHVRRHRVAQQVTRPGLAEFRRDDALKHRPRQMIAAERLTLILAKRSIARTQVNE
jgi:hypothetical protein